MLMPSECARNVAIFFSPLKEFPRGTGILWTSSTRDWSLRRVCRYAQVLPEEFASPKLNPQPLRRALMWSERSKDRLYPSGIDFTMVSKFELSTFIMNDDTCTVNCDTGSSSLSTSSRPPGLHHA